MLITKKFLFIPLFLTFFLIFSFLCPKKVIGGGGSMVWCNYSVYEDESMCTAAKHSSDDLTCPPGYYSNYSCDMNSGYYQYCYYCQRSADCAGSAYPSCGGNCPTGETCKGNTESSNCGCEPVCSVTAPSNLGYTSSSASSGTLTWSPGSSGSKQKLYGGDVKATVQARCPSGVGPGTGCAVKEEQLSSSLNSYATGDVLTPGTVYYWWVENVGSCTKSSATYVSISSCELGSGSLNVQMGQPPVNLITNLNSSTEITRVDYSTSTTIVPIVSCNSGWNAAECDLAPNCVYIWNGSCNGASSCSQINDGNWCALYNSQCSGTDPLCASYRSETACQNVTGTCFGSGICSSIHNSTSCHATPGCGWRPFNCGWQAYCHWNDTGSYCAENSSRISASPAVSLNPTSDSAYVYQTQVTALHAYDLTESPITQIVSNVYLGGVMACTDSIGVTVTPIGPWWQVKDSDILTNGSVVSDVPMGSIFDLDGTGGYPGVVAYGGSLSLAGGVSGNAVSSTNWNANTAVTPKAYDYAYVLSRVPSEIKIKPISSLDQVTLTTEDPSYPSHNGYRFFRYENSGGEVATTEDINVGTDKIVVLVDGNALIANKINLTNGGFFALFVQGNITIDPIVSGIIGGTPSLQGVYMANGTISTGTNGPKSDNQLYLKGSMAGLSGISLQRDLSSNESPAEYFEYAPDQMMYLLESGLSTMRINWKEVAP